MTRRRSKCLSLLSNLKLLRLPETAEDARVRKLNKFLRFLKQNNLLAPRVSHSQKEVAGFVQRQKKTPMLIIVPSSTSHKPRLKAHKLVSLNRVSNSKVSSHMSQPTGVKVSLLTQRIGNGLNTKDSLFRREQDLASILDPIL